MYHQNTMEFSEWIVAELEKRGWSRSEAARRGDISPSMFDKVINGHAKPGVKFIQGIAKAFRMTPAEVMLHVEKTGKTDAWVEEMTFKIKTLDPKHRSMVSTFIDSLLHAEESEVARQKTRPRHKSTTP